MTNDDVTLVAAARNGAPDAISTLYRRYWPLAWRWAYALTGERSRADDLAQDAVLRAFRSLHSFDEQRPFGPWLKRILLNVAADELRRLRRGQLAAGWMDDWRLAPAGVEVPDELLDAVRALSPARRLVLALHYWLDLSLDDIATLLDIPYGTVASRVSRARADVRRALEEAGVA